MVFVWLNWVKVLVWRRWPWTVWLRSLTSQLNLCPLAAPAQLQRNGPSRGKISSKRSDLGIRMLEVNVSLWLTLGVIPPHFILRSARARTHSHTQLWGVQRQVSEPRSSPSRTLLWSFHPWPGLSLSVNSTHPLTSLWICVDGGDRCGCDLPSFSLIGLGSKKCLF